MVILKKSKQPMLELLTSHIVSSIQSNLSLANRQWNEGTALTTRYFYIDNLLPEELCQEIYNQFPDDPAYRYENTFREKKRTFAKLRNANAIVESITYAFQEEEVLNLISQITGIAGLESDPKLYAGGISKMVQGDFLNPHIDNSHDADRKRYRRLNLLFYVTPEWEQNMGGNLALWNSRVTESTEITSSFNRLVVMETNSTSWHSVTPIDANASRCCVSNYYFSKPSPNNTDYYHVTSFMGRPEQSFIRKWCAADNKIRQWIATTIGITRGKRLMND